MTRMQSAPPARQAEQQTQQPQDQDFARLMSKNARIGGLYRSLSSRLDDIDAMLPEFMKGQGDRLIRRACITFSKNPDLQNISDEDYRRCVIEAAEMGFAIDGRLCYVVKYKNTYQLQLDYKAVVAVAKRNRTIKDIDADVVCANDRFRHGKFGGESVLEHTFDMAGDRGEVVGAYCRVFLPDGTWNYEVMTRSQLDSVQRRAPAQNGPWRTDPDEMRKKTVIRRKLKLYQDDPGLMRMLEITGWQDEADDEPAGPRTVDDLGKRLQTARTAAPPARTGYSEPPGEYRPEPTMAPPEDTYDRPATSEEVNQDLIDLASMDLGASTDLQGVDFVLQDLLKKPMNEATATAIRGLAEQRKDHLQAAEKAPKGKTQKQLA